MQAVLAVPDRAAVTSGSNPNIVGTMTAGASMTVRWTVKCQDKGAYSLQVSVSGIDSNGLPCSASDSITVTVSEEGPIPQLPKLSYLLLIIIGTLVAALLITLLVLLKRRRIRVTERD